MPLTDDQIIEITNANPPLCNCCKKRHTRIIVPHSSFNESGNYLFHCKITGRIARIRDVDWVVRNGRQEAEV